MSLAWAMTLFAAGNFPLPTANLGKLGVRSMREGSELIFVTVLARFTANIVISAVACWFGLGTFDGL